MFNGWLRAEMNRCIFVVVLVLMGLAWVCVCSVKALIGAGGRVFRFMFGSKS